VEVAQPGVGHAHRKPRPGIAGVGRCFLAGGAQGDLGRVLGVAVVAESGPQVGLAVEREEDDERPVEVPPPIVKVGVAVGASPAIVRPQVAIEDPDRLRGVVIGDDRLVMAHPAQVFHVEAALDDDREAAGDQPLDQIEGAAEAPEGAHAGQRRLRVVDVIGHLPG